MNTKCFRHAAFAIILTSALASPISAHAQSEKNAQQQRRPAPGDEQSRFQRAPGGLMGRAAPGFDRLQTVLTDEQRASLREAMQGQREKLRDLEEQIRDQRQQLMLAGLTDKFDEEAVRKMALAVAKVEAEMTVLRAKAFSQMRPVLTAEQIQKLKTTPTGAGPGPGSDQTETPRRRPDIPRDEHGLPLKDNSAQTKPQP